MYGAYPTGSHTWIFSVSQTGTLIDQYLIEGVMGEASFVILGNYVYVWQDAIKATGYRSMIIKLDLDLNLVCTKDCEGGNSGGAAGEYGRNITSDDDSYIFTYSRLSMGSDNSLVAKYEVP
jgi:hypothetical protein